MLLLLNLKHGVVVNEVGVVAAAAANDIGAYAFIDFVARVVAIVFFIMRLLLMTLLFMLQVLIQQYFLFLILYGSLNTRCNKRTFYGLINFIRMENPVAVV